MEKFAATLLNQFQAWSVVEIIAVFCAVLYLLLAIRQSIWCWIFAAISTALYVWIFLSAKLYMESVLNCFYFGMAVYGWFVWNSGDGGGQELPVRMFTVRVHLLAISIITLLVAAVGSWLSLNTDAAFPFIDSATTFAAIWATFLLARKVLENWWYFLIIDAISIYIFWSRGLELTALLYFLYLLMIPFGFFQWNRSYKGNKRQQVS